MNHLWFEQILPPEFMPLLGADADIVGCANANPATPFKGLEQAEAVIAGQAIKYDGAFMDQAPALRVISRTGIGVDNISIPDATARKIVVCNAPDAPTISSAELTLALMLATVKRLNEGAQDLKRGAPKDYFATYRGVEQCGLTLGVVGVGRIGSYVARVAQALGMRVLGYSRSLTAKRAAELGIERADSLEALFRASDVVTLHVPFTAESRHLINAKTLAQFKPGAFLINASRGGLVDEAALLQALEIGQLGGAGLDVFDPEPPRPDHPLLHREDVVVSPHIGGAAPGSRARIWRDSITQALQVLRGERPPNVLNPSVLSNSARNPFSRA